jgi:hypothetical protein
VLDSRVSFLHGAYAGERHHGGYGWLARIFVVSRRAGVAGVRRVVLVAAVAVVAAVIAPGVAWAKPERVCRVGDDRLTELSGLAVTPTGYVVVDDGADDAARRRIFFLDRRCAVVRGVAYPSRPRDTEDLALAADGTVWVGDIGDNGQNRETIALWRLAPGARKPQLYRMSYPDGAHNAETLLLTPDGTPVVVTKTVGAAGVYVPTAPLRAGRTTPLRQAGSVTVPVTATSNPFSLAGRLVLTGGAVSPDGRRVVLRTYADAFEYDVVDGDVVSAITKGAPRVTALPDEPQGESVAYSLDGAALLTVSEAGDRPARGGVEVLRYPLTEPVAPAGKSPAEESPAGKSPAGTSPAASEAPRVPDSSPEPTGGVPAGALVTGGVLLVGAVALGFLVARRSRRNGR